MTHLDIRQLLKDHPVSDAEVRQTLIEAIERNKAEILRMEQIGERAAAAHFRQVNLDYHAALKCIPR